MIYPENFEQKIGFDIVRKLLMSKCLCPLGEEKVTDISFSFDFNLIHRQLNQTNEFVRILQEEDFPLGIFYDARPALKKIRVEGTYLIEKELFDIRRSLQTIFDILGFFTLKKEEELYPYLQELASEADTFPQITSLIDRILDKFGNIKDNASPQLAHIRQELTKTIGSISKTLNSILRVAQSEGFVDKDITPTIREGRLVIPVAPAYKRKLKGIVHDESASGKTVFIEPAEVVESNNKIRELESEERREVVRILTDFTNQARPFIPQIVNSYQFLALIDFIRAKALLALDIQAILPIFENKSQLDWYRAIHPLLYLTHRKQNKPVVPLDITLDEHKGRILLISGPNAGGKSVCLKTTGLLQYMLQCGLLIPVYENSHTGIFDDIFIDIGDEQSIENDLSTYSSHLMNMKFFVKNCSPKSLLLIDEFGSGTEPQIGGAIAEALLERFNQKQSFGVITTHYQNLKHYAEDHEGIVNGAMLYDRHQMQPLFKLSIGNPGSSFAIEIARKIGLPEDVIADASEKVGQDYINMDKYLQDIVRDKRYWESKRQHVRQQEKKLEELTERYKTDLEKIEKQKKEIISNAKAEAENVLTESNAKIENIIREIREAQAEKEKTKTLRKSLDEFKESLAQQAETDDFITRKIQKIQQRETQKKKEKQIGEQPAFNSSIIEAGDIVRLSGQTSTGQVSEIKGKNAVVVFGSVKSTVALERLEKISKNQLKREEQRQSSVNYISSSSDKKLNFKLELDVRGMRADEALQAVTYYIDDAIQCNTGRVRILHGTGTGVLRQVIRNYLKTTPGIIQFHDEHVQFGGAGITVVEL